VPNVGGLASCCCSHLGSYRLPVNGGPTRWATTGFDRAVFADVAGDTSLGGEEPLPPFGVSNEGGGFARIATTAELIGENRT